MACWRCSGCGPRCPTDGGYMQSFRKVRDWLLTGRPGKTLRVISNTAPLAQDDHGKAKLPDESNTRFVLAHEHGFNKESFEGQIAELTAKGAIKEPLKVTATDLHPDPKDKSPGTRLEATVTITGPSGVKGTLLVYRAHTDHFGVRNDTMAPLIAAGGSGKPDIFDPPAKPAP